MFPPVHLALGYLVYSGLRRSVGERPAPGPALAAVGGGAVPDLVDQPLYYALGLSSTRTLGHSLLVAVPIGLAAVLVARRLSVPDAVGAGFAVGYLAHPPADALWPLALGLERELGFLLWPVTHSPEYVGRKPLFVVGDLTVTTLWFELPLLALGVVAWWRDGAPGVSAVRERLTG
jgi:hypothetical protein